MKLNGSWKWLKHLSGCHQRGWEAFHKGVPNAKCPYVGSRSALQRARMSEWCRGWNRASQGLPLDDTDG